MAVSMKRRSFYADLDHLRSCFDTLDPEKTGFIGYEELTKLVESMPNTEESVVPELMEKLDRDKDGKVSFDDFVCLFELERKAMSKKQKLSQPELVFQQVPEASVTVQSPTNQKDINTSPTSPSDYKFGDSMGGVVLRHNRRRMTLPSTLRRYHTDISLLSPIQSHVTKRPPSNDITDLASQMKYLTDADESVDSPQMKRSSKVLSWIETEDLLFEDTGTGLRGVKEMPSPPLSPKHGSNEVSHVASILESACSTKEIDEEAVAKLCEHVKADPQELQELLALLNHLDKEKKGSISVNEFAQGLQDIKNSSKVGASTPIHQPLRRVYSEVTPPRLGEPFSTPNHGSKPLPLSSTPLTLPSVKHSMTANILTAIDPNQSGYVKVDELITFWQNIGVEAPNDQSLEKVVTETLPVDPNGRISVNDVTATLEGSILTEGRSQNVLRHVALKSFKNEISTLKTKIHHVSLERDKLKSSLNRTMEEKQKLIAEGDEHVEMVTKKSERKIKEQKREYSERIKEVERTKQEEALQLQERASNAIKEIEGRMEELKKEEEKLRQELRYAQDDTEDITEQLNLARKELIKKDKTIASLKKDLGSRSDHDMLDDGSQVSRIGELEIELSEKNELITELQEKLREIQDSCDELKAENEKMKQKYVSQKRSMQKSKSFAGPSRTSSAKKRHSIGDTRKRLNRPLSGSHFHRRSMPLHPHIPTSMDLDLAVNQQNHPVLQEEGNEEEVDFMIPMHDEVPDSHLHEDSQGDMVDEKLSESDGTTESDDDVFGQSAASLMEEFHQEKLSTQERQKNLTLTEELKKQRETIVHLKKDIQRLEDFSESQEDQILKLEEEKAEIAEKLTELQYTLESEQRSHEVEVNILSRKLENAENSAMKLEASAEKLMKERKQLQEEIVVMKSKHSAIAEKLEEQLQASEKREKDLRNKMVINRNELEATLSQIDNMHRKEGTYRDQKALLEAKEIRLNDEVSQLKSNVIKLQEEISQLKSAAAAYKNKISLLKAELQKGAESDEFIPIQTPNRRSSTSPDTSRHGEIIIKMQSQLEELQKVLDSKVANSEEDGETQDSPEMNLIHKLLSNSTMLDAELQKMRRWMSAEHLSHLQACSQRDENIHQLQTEKEKANKAVRKLTLDLSESFGSQFDALQSNCNQSLSRFKFKIHEAKVKLAAICVSLKDKDLQYTNALEMLQSDLNQSRHEVSMYKDEMGKLQLELETSHHSLDKLNESQDRLTKLHIEKDAEMDELRSKLEQAIKGNDGSQVSSSTLSSRSVTVDADSGQVIADQDETQERRDEVLLQKEEVIHSLRDELEIMKRNERHARAANEEANIKLAEKDKELRQTKDKVEDLQRKTRELESRLEQEADQHASELTSSIEVITKNTAEARELYSHLLNSDANATSIPEYAIDLNHSQLIAESMKEINKLRDQLNQQQRVYIDLENTLAAKMEEHELLESQFTMEHEEEVRALRQQKQQLMQQLEESKGHYQNILDDQEQQSSIMLQGLMNSKAVTEKQLRDKSEEILHVYQQVADLSEEKKVLIDIIKQLCLEAGRRIDLV